MPKDKNIDAPKHSPEGGGFGSPNPRRKDIPGPRPASPQQAHSEPAAEGENKKPKGDQGPTL